MSCRVAIVVPVLAARSCRERSASGHERGIASMLTIAMAALLVMAAVVAVGVGQVVAARHTAAAAADLGALAGVADAGQSDCSAATRVVIANDAEPVDCTVTGSDVVVTAASRTHALLGLSWTLRSTARAGPARR